MSRYLRNFNTLSQEEHDKLRRSKVCVVGCGGLGGHIIEMLARLGLGTISAVDGDVFEESNLNRQILSNEKTIGLSKAKTAKERMSIVNPEIKIIAIDDFVDQSNAEEILQGHDVIVDALDNIPSRMILQEASKKLGIPLVYGAIAGWYGQVSTIFPGDDSLNKLYREGTEKGIEKELGNPSFTPALIASIQVSEVVKIIIKRGDLLRNKLLYIDTLEQDYQLLNI